jgi:alkylhydroperoxidase family enzyme
MTQDELWDVGAIAAFFSMSNRLANAMDLQPNLDFQGIGRA